MHRYVFEFQMPIWKKCLKALRNIQERGFVFMETLLMAKIPIFTWMAQNSLLKQFEKKYLAKTVLNGQFYGMDSFMVFLVRIQYFDVR